MENEKPGFDYSCIPPGYYDDIALRKTGIRSFWHHLKFKRIIDSFDTKHGSILDIGCFAGTFLGMIAENIFDEQVGIDILPAQVKYANEKYSTAFRNFFVVKNFSQDGFLKGKQFDRVTIIEVIEHLTGNQIAEMLNFAHSKLKPGGKLIITTPNYTSAWPLLELALNKFSNVKYDEQHITRFNYFSVFDKLGRIMPGFSEMFKPDFKTTTHLLTPFLAGISYQAAEKISSAVSPAKWKLPLGSLLLLQMHRK